MKYEIPLDKIPNQTIKVELDGKECELTFITRGNNVYMDKFSVESVNKLNGIVCLNGNNLFDLVHFKGRLYFKDLDGDENPTYTGFGTRWKLFYEDL